MTVRRTTLMAVAVLAAGCLIGGFLGTNLRAQAFPAPPTVEVETFSQILAIIEDNYVGEVSSRQLVEHAIQGMLRRLDPHSNYLDAESYNEMKDEQRGEFSGLGIQIAKRDRDKPLTIIAPIDGTPADRARLQAGDIIYKIEGEETIHLTVQEAVQRLKGDRGTKVTITIKRPGLKDMFDVTLVRDKIPIHSLKVAYMIEPTTGYIRIFNFTSTTARELDEAIGKLSQQGMQRLILDLRNNPGGLLEQAVQVAERFIDDGKLVVYTRGRVSGADQDYLVTDGVERFDMPLVVLVDRYSASASEIVSGAIQDHDRGLVVGETTFGKGLVQRVIGLSDGGALAVTTAKYYTPSGRLIQRDYSDLDSYYFEEAEPEEGPLEESLEPPADRREVFHTASGRKVYGGGGITPDYIVKAERYSGLFARLFRENLFFDFAVQYASAHPELERGFVTNGELLEGFRKFLDAREFRYAPEEFEQDGPRLLNKLQAQISRVKWSQEEESRVLAQADPMIQKALTLFDEAARLAAAPAAGDRAALR
jgi:carboxyl-terminal processing protease